MIGSILILAAAASADSFIVGFNYGCKGVRISPSANGLIALFCFVGTYLSMVLGRMAGGLLAPNTAHLIGGAMLLVIGLWMICSCLSAAPKPLRDYSEHPEKVDKDCSRSVELRESFLVGLVLSVNNIGLGLGGGMSGISTLLTPLACSLFSYLFIMAGRCLGRTLHSPRISRLFELLSAGLILLLGLRELLAAL